MQEKGNLSDIDGAELAAGLTGFALGLRPKDIFNPLRGTREQVEARHIAMYLAYVGMGVSMARVAQAFGRDRSTVAKACTLIEDRRENAAFDAWIDVLETSMRQLCPLKEAR